MRTQISFNEISSRGVWSPSLYQNDFIATNTWLPLEAFLDDKKPRTKGFEPGSDAYVSRSTVKFLRTKAFSREFSLLYPRGDALIHISPHAWNGEGLQSGDVLVVKDSNVGEIAVVPDGDWSKTGWSNGVAKLNIQRDKDYLIGFLKFGNFREQVEAMTPRGATIKHAGDKWLKAKVPLPGNAQRDQVLALVGTLTRATLTLENKMIELASRIKSKVSSEILENQKASIFAYSEPQVSGLLSSGRFDAAFHSAACKKLLFLAENYQNGFEKVDEAGFTVIPGPSLEIKILKKRVDSEKPVSGYYQMFVPKNISEYGTMVSVPYMGTPAQLPLLHMGDVIVGEAGFRKGRSFILVDTPEKASTNAHGLIVRRADKNLKKSVAFRCIFDWYRSTGLIDLLAVGGSGGHFSPSYFKLLALPKLSEEFQQQLLELYVGNNLPRLRTYDYKSGETPDIHLLVDWLLKESEELGVLRLSQATSVINDKLRSIFTKLSLGETIYIADEIECLVTALGISPQQKAANLSV